MNAPPLLPWLWPYWMRLWHAHGAGRLGHAWLIAGLAGLGKRALAEHLAHTLLCSSPVGDGVPCGQCAECRLLRAGHHPDWLKLEPDGTTQEIKVDAVRALIEHDNLTPRRGIRKIVCIAPAEAMNRAAANALLKTLEEPAAKTLLVLVSEEPSHLPATVLSRCQRLALVAPAEAEVLPWLVAQLGEQAHQASLALRLAHGAPLRAVTLAQTEILAARTRCFEEWLAVAHGQRDPLAAAATWQAFEHELVLEWLAGWVGDMARLRCDPQAAFLAHPDHRAALLSLTGGLDLRQIHRYFRELLRARRLLDATVNKPLLFEALAIRWALLTEEAR